VHPEGLEHAGAQVLVKGHAGTACQVSRRQHYAGVGIYTAPSRGCDWVSALERKARSVRQQVGQGRAVRAAGIVQAHYHLLHSDQAGLADQELGHRGPGERLLHGPRRGQRARRQCDPGRAPAGPPLETVLQRRGDLFSPSRHRPPRPWLAGRASPFGGSRRQMPAGRPRSAPRARPSPPSSPRCSPRSHALRALLTAVR